MSLRGTTSLLAVAALAILGVGPTGTPAGALPPSIDLTPPSGGCVRPANGTDLLCTFSYTGAVEEWSVPPGVTDVDLAVYGAQGGETFQIPGGLGGRASASLDIVAPGDPLSMVVGGRGTHSLEFSSAGGGGFGGGGAAFINAAGGGGASSVSLLGARILVGGGGGGSTSSQDGGDGGGPNGTDGETVPRPEGATTGEGGRGATQSAPGAGGPGTPNTVCEPDDPGTFSGTPGSAGSGAVGGLGGAGGSASHGGGGGGGWFGGGGGGGGAYCGSVSSGGGGGGGSSNALSDASVTGVSYETGVRSGNGLITVGFSFPDANGAPSVTIDELAGQDDPATDSPVSYLAVFSQAVTGFTSSDVDLTDSTATGPLSAAVTEVSPNDGTTYQVDVTGMSGNGAVVAKIPAGKAVDGEFSTNVASTSVDNTVSFIVDADAPTASPVVTPTPNASGWANSAVTITWNWTDGSGLGIDPDECDSSTFLATERDRTAVVESCPDLGGNVGEGSVTVGIDLTAPLVAPTVTPNPVVLGGSAVAAANAFDELSGVASEGCEPLNTATIGVRMVTCTATDAAGNSESGSATYTVGATFGGYTSPLPRSLPLQSGATIPVKFRLGDVNGALSSSASAALASNGQVRVALIGPGASNAVVVSRLCKWDTRNATFACDLKVPKNVAKGAANPYRLTAQHKGISGSFFDVGGAGNPLVLTFK